MFIFDPVYFLLIAPAVILSIYAQAKVSRTFKKFSKVSSVNRYSGAKAARAILDSHGLHKVEVEEIPGQLTDHYDPRNKTLRLSTDVYGGRSLSALGVAAHEAGHALQDATAYTPLRIRNSIVPVANFGSNGAVFLFIIGFLAHFDPLMRLAIIFFSAAVFFYLITLPVEFNASTRAIQTLRNEGIIYENEKQNTKKVLNAAALTYLAAALMAIMQLLYFILLRRRR